MGVGRIKIDAGLKNGKLTLGWGRYLYRLSKSAEVQRTLKFGG